MFINDLPDRTNDLPHYAAQPLQFAEEVSGNIKPRAHAKPREQLYANIVFEIRRSTMPLRRASIQNHNDTNLFDLVYRSNSLNKTLGYWMNNDLRAEHSCYIVVLENGKPAGELFIKQWMFDQFTANNK